MLSKLVKRQTFLVIIKVKWEFLITFLDKYNPDQFEIIGSSTVET